MTLKLLNNHQILDYINNKQVFLNHSLLVTMVVTIQTETFHLSLEVDQRFLELRLKVKEGQIGEIRTCLRISK